MNKPAFNVFEYPVTVTGNDIDELGHVTPLSPLKGRLRLALLFFLCYSFMTNLTGKKNI